MGWDGAVIAWAPVSTWSSPSSSPELLLPGSSLRTDVQQGFGDCQDLTAQLIKAESHCHLPVPLFQRGTQGCTEQAQLKMI